MRFCALEELRAERDLYDASVRRSDEVDQFCTSSNWILPAFTGLQPGRVPFIAQAGDHYAVLARAQHPDGWWMLQPFECAWLLSTPLVGPSARGRVEVLRFMLDAHPASWSVLALSGLAASGELLGRLLRTFERGHRLWLGEPTVRHVINLSEGAEGFLARRSRYFRRNLRRVEQRAQELGVELQPCVGTSDEAFARLMKVERQSWKAKEGGGLVLPEMAAFYRDMMDLLQEHRALLLSFARHRGQDVGYILGGLFGATYRGLQFSFHDAYREVGLGNLMQWYQLCNLPGSIEHYDLGSHSPYKERWADAQQTSVTLFVAKG